MRRAAFRKFRLRAWSPLFLLAGFALTAGAQTPIVELRVEGNARLSSDSVIAASGLKIGAAVTRQDLDAAAQKLFGTGFFRSVNYRYQPKPGDRGTGYVVTLQVTEEKAERPVMLDIPGRDDAELWAALRRADSFIDVVMPDNEQSAAYYQRVLETALNQSGSPTPITMKTEAELGTGKMVAIFRPANLPSVKDIRFEGNQQIRGPALDAAVDNLVVGNEYSERELRRILDLNIKPLYEEKGLLTVTFPTVKVSGTGAVSVIVTVDEGRVWTLGKVEIAGDRLPLEEMRNAAKFPEGKPANWKLVKTEIAAMENVLKRDGYLAVSSNPERIYRKDDGVVDVTLRVNKGKQFHFGSLQLSGLDAAGERQARTMWKMREGEPLDAPSIDDFLRAVFKGPAQGMHSVQQQMNLRSGTDVIDVVIGFK